MNNEYLISYDSAVEGVVSPECENEKNKFLQEELNHCLTFIERDSYDHLRHWKSFKLRIGLSSYELKYSIFIMILIETSASIIPVIWQTRTNKSPCIELIDHFEVILAEIEAALYGQQLERKIETQIVLEPWTGSHYVHECFGHTLEADNYLEYLKPNGITMGYKWSEYKINVFDDPTIPGQNGSYLLDAEQNEAFRTNLIKDGVNVGLMHNAKTCKLLGLQSSCNARSVDSSSLSMPRMSTTYLDSGNMEVQEIISGIDNGIYCRGAWGGGSLGLNFVIRPAYGLVIKNGKLTNKILRRFDIKGNKLDSAKAIKSLSNELLFFNPVFGCNKNGENNLSVTQGSPHIHFENLTLYPVL